MNYRFRLTKRSTYNPTQVAKNEHMIIPSARESETCFTNCSPHMLPAIEPRAAMGATKPSMRGAMTNAAIAPHPTPNRPIRNIPSKSGVKSDPSSGASVRGR